MVRLLLYFRTIVRKSKYQFYTKCDIIILHECVVLRPYYWTLDVIWGDSLRKALYSIIRDDDENQIQGTIYDSIMIVAVVASIVPLAFKNSDTVFFNVIDKISVAVFIFDYASRFLTADFKIQRGLRSFLLYPITPMGIVDLLAILPSFTNLWRALRLLKIFRLFRALRVFRAFKVFRYSKSLRIISNVIRSQRRPLMAVCVLAGGYILLSALVIFNVEPETFDTFFDAIYWAAISLTTVGYGDIYPVTTAGRIVTMISSFVGIAIVALPAGIITAGYMDVIQHDSE